MGSEVRMEDAPLMNDETGVDDAPGVQVPSGMAWARVALEREPTSFEFVQAVRLLERIHSDRSGPGRFVDPSSEVVRFAVPPTLAFPASSIQALRLPESPGSRARMEVNFFGLTGPSGVLPHEYTILVGDRMRARDRAMADFLDLFNHRAISLFYRALRKHRFDLAREAGEEDRLQSHLLHLAGVRKGGEGGASDRVPGEKDPEGGTDPALSPGVLASFAGLLGPQRRSAATLEQLVEGVFGISAQVVEFVGGWYTIGEGDRTAVGEENTSSSLGLGAVAGDEVWDPQARVRIRLGPLNREEYDAFLPGGKSHALLRSLTRFFSDDQFEFEIQPVLRKEEVPPCLPGDDASEFRLGWSTWLRTREPEHDMEDTLIRL
ncbi:type VI secretion system baseplate subunit TssG [soil metagenome]